METRRRTPSARGCKHDGPPATKLHIFDMDGTLQRGNACLELSRHVGQLDAILDIEERWAAGHVDHVEFYELCLPLWKELTPAAVEQVFASAEWLDGVSEVFADIQQRGEHAVVITGSPQFFADLLLRWGPCSVHGAGVEVGVQPVLERVVTPESKITLTHELLDHHGLTVVDCVAYSDSGSDIPLFRALPLTVAVNASDSLKAVATAVYDGGDLRGAYAAGRALLEGTPCRTSE